MQKFSQPPERSSRSIDSAGKQPGEIRGERQRCRYEGENNHCQASQVRLGLGARLTNLNPLTKIVAARGAPTIPLRPDHIVTIVAPEEHWLFRAKLLSVGKLKVGP